MDRTSAGTRFVRRPARLLVAFMLATCLLNVSSAAAATRSVGTELTRLEQAGAIDPATAADYRAINRDARALLLRLTGSRRIGLRAPLVVLDRLARSGQLTAGRVASIMLTVQRNREWWCCKPLPVAGQRHRFGGRQIVWQHYPGQGWQIQWLGTFGRANALWSFRGKDDELRSLVDDAIALATPRAGGTAWEYLLAFGSGQPPWVSAMAQGTGIQALARAAVRLKEPAYFEAAREALGVFETSAPTGAAVRTAADRTHYLLYSFARSQRVLNGFTQAINGLHDFAVLANDERGRELYLRGVRQLATELRGYDTGGWSLYQRGGLGSTVGYHTLARDFLRGLCTRIRSDRTRAASAPAEAAQGGGGGGGGGGAVAAPDTPAEPRPVDALAAIDPEPFCAKAQRFTDDTRVPALLEIRSQRTRAGLTPSVKVSVNKPVTITATLMRGTRTVGSVTTFVQAGVRTIVIAPKATAGRHRLTLSARDPVGLVTEAEAVLPVTKP